MTYRTPRQTKTRRAGRLGRVVATDPATRLLAGLLAVCLFSVDTIRPVASYADSGASQPREQAADSAQLPSPGEQAPGAPVPRGLMILAWTSPWIPPGQDMGAVVPVQLVVRAAPGNAARAGTSMATGGLPTWIAPSIPSLNPSVAAGAGFQAWTAQVRPLSIRECRQIVPVGPPSA